ncbi:hypothetical protein ACJX0J_013702 [Zea mays]
MTIEDKLLKPHAAHFIFFHEFRFAPFHFPCNKWGLWIHIYPYLHARFHICFKLYSAQQEVNLKLVFEKEETQVNWDTKRKEKHQNILDIFLNIHAHLYHNKKSCTDPIVRLEDLQMNISIFKSTLAVGGRLLTMAKQYINHYGYAAVYIFVIFYIEILSYAGHAI